MKNFLALLLIATMLLSCISCATHSNPVSGTTAEDNHTETVLEEETKFVPQIEQKNYDCDFTVGGQYFIKDNLLVTEEERGSTFEDAVYERTINVEEHLGVRIVEAPSTSDAASIIRTIQAGDDAYQLISTHCYSGISTFLSKKAVRDFASLESVNLTAPYWAGEFMENVKVQNQYLMGYNDSCLMSVYTIVFNKALMEEYNLTAPYDEVRNKTWTMEKVTALASIVSKDNGDGIWTTEDTYGFTGWGWTDAISFAISSDIKIVDRDSSGTFEVAYGRNSERTYAALEKLSALYNAEFSWNASPELGRTEIPFEEGHTLMNTMPTRDVANLRDLDFNFGIVPYPLFDEQQKAYHSMNWAGVILVPSSITNDTMVGEVIELLAYYTEPVKVAYYEDLLGTKVADAVDDSEMLEIIWDSVSFDMGLALGGLEDLNDLLYMFPTLCVSGIDQYSSFLKRHEKRANSAIERLFSQYD